MKKILTFCVTTFVLLGVLFATVPSCTRDEVYLSQSGQMDADKANDEAFALLNEQVCEYSASFVANYPSDQTRSWFGRIFRKIWKCIKITLADVVGGVIGVVIEGDWGSTSQILSSKAARAKDNLSTENGKKYVPTGNLIIPADNTLDSIGIRHNIVIKEVYNSDPEGFFTCTDDELAEKIIRKNEEQHGWVSPLVMHRLPAVSKKVDTITAAIQKEVLNHLTSSSTEKEAIDALGAAIDIIARNMPESRDELMVVKRYLQTIVQLPENQIAEEYTVGFRRLVGTSAISDASKSKIQSAVSIGINSDLLWQETD